MLYRVCPLLGKDLGEHYVGLRSYLYLFEGHYLQPLLLAGVECPLAESLGPDFSTWFLKGVEHARSHDCFLIFQLPDTVDIASEQLYGARAHAFEPQPGADLLKLNLGTEDVLVLGVHVHPVAPHHLFHRTVSGSLLGVGVLLGHSGDIEPVRHHGVMLGAHPVEVCSLFDVPVGFALMDLVLHEGALLAGAVCGVLVCFSVTTLALEPDLLKCKRPNDRGVRGFDPNLRENTVHNLHTKVWAEKVDNLLTHGVIHLTLRIAAVLYHTRLVVVVLLVMVVVLRLVPFGHPVRVRVRHDSRHVSWA